MSSCLEKNCIAAVQKPQYNVKHRYFLCSRDPSLHKLAYDHKRVFLQVRWKFNLSPHLRF